MYYFRGPIGLFKIKPYNGRYQLWFNGDIVGVYNSAVAAADDVYTHTTGCYEWDDLDGRVTPPSDLSEWTTS